MKYVYGLIGGFLGFLLGIAGSLVAVFFVVVLLFVPVVLYTSGHKPELVDSLWFRSLGYGIVIFLVAGIVAVASVMGTKVGYRRAEKIKNAASDEE